MASLFILRLAGGRALFPHAAGGSFTSYLPSLLSTGAVSGVTGTSEKARADGMIALFTATLKYEKNGVEEGTR